MSNKKYLLSNLSSLIKISVSIERNILCNIALSSDETLREVRDHGAGAPGDPQTRVTPLFRQNRLYAPQRWGSGFSIHKRERSLPPPQ
jgi:hypothetical protein